MSAPDELKPCPFCGAPAYMTSKPPWVVTCPADACAAFIDVPGSTADDAAARWNRRAPAAPQGAEIARDAARYRWLRENIDYIIDDGDGIQGAAFGCQGISLERMQSASDAELLDDVCDYCVRSAIAASGGAKGDGNG